VVSKSLGQIAFEARLLHEDGFILPNEWAACAEEHAAWQAAAEAVLKEIEMEVRRGGAMSRVPDVLEWEYVWSKLQELSRAKAKLRQYEPVIEAARALKVMFEALETAEKEGR
jgi:hypothetical protein